MADIAKLGLVSVGADTPGGLFTAETSISALVLLLRYLRNTITATLPEITQIPETVFAFPLQTNGMLATPFLVMIGKAPRPGDAAVGELLQILTFEFVYVHVSVFAGVVDMQEYVRNQLVKLQRAFLHDYRQGGYCNATRLVSAPIDHLNTYQKLFAEQAQPVTALEMTLEFDVIEVEA